MTEKKEADTLESKLSKMFWKLTYDIEMVETEGIAIIGRDILNRFITTLHGPNSQLEIK